MSDSAGKPIRLSRRQWLAVTGCGVAAAIGSDGWLIEPNRLAVSSHSLAPPAVGRPQGSGRNVSGWYRDINRVPMYVSRGIGTSVVPIRLGAVPEIAVFDL